MTDLKLQAAELEQLAQTIRAEQGASRLALDRLLERHRRELDRRLAAPLARLTRLAERS